ncbi:MAG TPA: class II aldolase/adducin family protein [Vicinamibacterales bacterium]|nr:class II aldolase/adducin family protein [Vicinamibacterales bacterium]
MTGKAAGEAQRMYPLMRETGRAIMLVRGNNTHSGNLALRDPDDRDVFHITASGSQLGALVASDVVPVRFSRVSWGDGRASTESTIHRRILAIPGVEASIHAHYLSAISVSFDAKEAENFLLYEGNVHGTEEFSFVPVDRTGAWVLGNVPSGTYLEPVGSKEMEARIPRYLAASPATLVKGHGPFVRGGSLGECLHVLGVVDASAMLLQAARLRGVDTTAIARRIREVGPSVFYPMPVRAFDAASFGTYDTRDEATIRGFRERAAFNYVQGVCPYATGSMSEKITEHEMLYCPTASAPEGFEIAIRRLSIEADEGDDWELAFHKTLYRETTHKACIITQSPLASAEGLAVLAERYGVEALVRPESVPIDYADRIDHPVVKPIDAEAVYLNPRVGLCRWDAPVSAVLDMLRWHKGACFIAGVGAIGAGKVTLEQAAHHVSSGESIARFRQAVHLAHVLRGGPPLSHYEPATQ